ncbi:nuclear transport factor 2 family protein [Nocardia grenadensis]
MNQLHQDVVLRYLRNLENGDFATARSLCSPAATVWHNDGKGEQTIDENVSSMEDQFPSIESMRYEVIRQFADQDGVLQQHIVHVATTGGMRGTLHAAAYFGFDGDLITRIEEYANFVPSDRTDLAP